MCFNASFWNERYLNQQTGWDLKAPSPPLKAYIDQLTDRHLNILIPGCGNAHEAAYLIEKGFQSITLIDIADEVVKTLQEKFKHYPQITVLNQDFFDLDGKYDLIFEQTFFCALAPTLRPNYVAKMHQLLRPNGLLVGVLFDHDFGNTLPPFGGSLAEYQELFKNLFEFKTIEPCKNSISPRMGRELFIQLQPSN